jgi:HSP20 family protein
MSRIAKWLPFKFIRRNKKGEAAGQAMQRSTPMPMHPGAQFGHMNRMFDHMMSDRGWRDPLGMVHEAERFFGDFAPTVFRPNIDIVDDGKQVKVTAELPGLDKNDIELTVQDGLMTLRGEKKSEEESTEEGCYRIERYFGQFSRAVPLPAEIDVDQADARFEKGVLTVRFPKTREDGGSRRISLR